MVLQARNGVTTSLGGRPQRMFKATAQLYDTASVSRRGLSCAICSDGRGRQSIGTPRQSYKFACLKDA
jgi:hypothetical protein